MKLAVLEFRRVLTRKWILVWFVLLLGVGLWVSVLFTEQQFSNTGINLERYLYLTRQYAEMPVLQVRSFLVRLLQNKLHGIGGIEYMLYIFRA